MGIKRIVTHGGPFHIFDVAAVAVVSTVFSDALIVRASSMDDLESALENADECLFVETGLDLDRPFNPRPNNVPYSSFGLVWDDHGIAFVKAILEAKSFPDVTPSFAFRIARAIEQKWAHAIDIEMAESPSFSRFPDIAPLTLRAVIESMNPPSESDDNIAFCDAMHVFHGVLSADVLRHARMFRASDAIARAIDAWSGNPTDPVVFDEYADVWREQISATDALFVVMPWFDANWQAMAVQRRPGDRRAKAKAPESWRGLEGDRLVQETGVQDAVACHCEGHAFSARSASGAIALARRAAKAHIESTMQV